MRTSGILLHPTSLPGPHGSGDLGDEARRFVRFLQRAGQTWWQVLPLHPPGPGDSPYQALSTFAGSPLLIDLNELVHLHLVEAAELETITLASRRQAEFERSAESRLRMLALAFDEFEQERTEEARQLARELEVFEREQANWLETWCLFATLREENQKRSWIGWTTETANREPDALDRVRREHARELRRHAFYQLLFQRQWSALRHYAAERGVRILGDLPMFVAHDSADVWARRELFRLDENGMPLCVSGAPPDDFNPAGQVWGHPLFDWAAVEAHGWNWWRQRVAHAIALSDSVRLDHFVGYNAAWEVPVPESGHWNSSEGRYGPGPGATLFTALAESSGELPFVAEDLGDMNDEVEALRVRLGFPGMRILQFGFSGDARENIHLPHNYARDSIAYTGTHDNDTIAGWFQSLKHDETTRARILELIGGHADEAPWNLVRAAALSVSDTAILPVQDLFGMRSRARMNRPGSAEGNWRFRLRPHEATDAKADELGRLTRAAGRWPA